MFGVEKFLFFHEMHIFDFPVHIAKLYSSEWKKKAYVAFVVSHF